MLTTLGRPSGVAGGNILRIKSASDFPALANDPIVRSQLAYFEANAPKATTAQALLSNPQLQDFALTASNFAWTVNPANQSVFDNPSTANPTDLVTGAAAVGNPGFIQQVVQKYLEAQLEAVAGDQSNTLREARYAQQQRPGITNWYSVISDPALANVVQTVLGLPPSFGALNITQQAQVYGQRLTLADFQNPTKLNQMLEQFVALSNAQSAAPSTSVAVNLLNATSAAMLFSTAG